MHLDTTESTLLTYDLRYPSILNNLNYCPNHRLQS